MTKAQRLKNEVASTLTILREAASKLGEWAVILTTDFFKSTLPPEEVRAVSHALAKQGGRLEMALDMARQGKARK